MGVALAKGLPLTMALIVAMTMAVAAVYRGVFWARRARARRAIARAPWRVYTRLGTGGWYVSVRRTAVGAVLEEYEVAFVPQDATSTDLCLAEATAQDRADLLEQRRRTR
jgi:hypothetical protein